MKKEKDKSQIIIYKDETGKTKIDVRFENETVWLSQSQIVELFKSSKANISEHITNIFAEGELQENSVVRKFRTTASDGKSYVIKHYALDLIISLGYRVRSSIATNFRVWATARLREYIIKGFILDDERLKEGGGGNYWKELLDRIRDIRSSEKAFYRQVLDLYATSIDYDPKALESIMFFKTVQNKLHYATNQQTAAELIFSRAHAGKDFMGVTTFKGAQPVKSEISIAKNYLTESELFRLNRLVSAFFDLAEIKVKEQKHMSMKDWLTELDKFSGMYGKGVLKNAGSISSSKAVKKATEEYKKYQERTLSPVEKSYLETIKSIEKKVDKK